MIMMPTAIGHKMVESLKQSLLKTGFLMCYGVMDDGKIDTDFTDGTDLGVRVDGSPDHSQILKFIRLNLDL